jgi:ABC-2 type transport system permease protein
VTELLPGTTGYARRRETPPAAARGPVRPTTWAALTTVFRQQLARGRVARVSLLFVASFQSIGLLLLLRGVLSDSSDTTGQQVVAGSTVLVVAFVALNLLAQRFGAMRASGALDYYLTLPVPPGAVVLATAASYATFAIPGTVITAVVGGLVYDLPLGRLWLLAPVIVLTGAALAGLGALLGLLAPRPELATVAGQLGMSAVLFLDIIPASHLPLALRIIRAAIPGTYGADVLAVGFRAHVPWGQVGIDLLICLLVALVSLAAGGWALRRAARR